MRYRLRYVQLPKISMLEHKEFLTGVVTFRSQHRGIILGSSRHILPIIGVSDKVKLVLLERHDI
ncbi:MAG: hypothetical protein D4R82_01265 [Dehalococcoidia bacterium]|nr:MAG: hypothetical protein D4R82_01265 [Dehalococcoidia bacterium]